MKDCVKQLNIFFSWMLFFKIYFILEIKNMFITEEIQDFLVQCVCELHFYFSITLTEFGRGTIQKQTGRARGSESLNCFVPSAFHCRTGRSWQRTTALSNQVSSSYTDLGEVWLTLTIWVDRDVCTCWCPDTSSRTCSVCTNRVWNMQENRPNSFSSWRGLTWTRKESCAAKRRPTRQTPSPTRRYRSASVVWT